MISKIKKPVSILLVFMMIVSLFAAVPMTVNAAPPGGGGGGTVIPSKTITLYANNGTDQSYSQSNTAGILNVTNPLAYDFTTPDNKTFSSWNTQPDGTGADYGSSFNYNFSSDLTLYAQWVTLYTVTWNNWDDTELETDEVEEGATPTYTGETPEKAEDENYTYTFAGWTPEVVAATADATYTATFTATKKPISSTDLYEGLVLDKDNTIKFIIVKSGENWRRIDLSVYLDGTLVKELYTQDVSTTEPDRYYTTTKKCIVDSYEFSYGDPVRHVLYLKSVYDVTWKNDDGTELEKDENVVVGTTPTYDGADPEKAEDEKYTYTFAGWTPEVVAATADATYTAQYTATFKGITSDQLYDGLVIDAGTPIKFMIIKSGQGWRRVDLSVYLDGTLVKELVTQSVSQTEPDRYYTTTKKCIVDSYEFSNGDPTRHVLYLKSVYDVTWKNDDGTELEKDENVVVGTTPTYNGTTPEKAEDENYTYTFAGWSPEITAVTGDITYTATYTETAKPKDLFPQHSITLGGNIGVNFYIDSAAADFANASTAVVKFTWDGGGEDRTKEVNLKELTPDADGYYKATVDVVAAQMAHEIHAEVYLNGEKLEQTDDYSVQDYAETVYANPEKYDSEKPEQLKALAKALLNYGAMAQTVFASSLKEHPALANSTVGDNGYEGVTADQIEGAINGTASDLNEVATQLGAKYYTNSLIYLSKNTLRIYFTPTSYPGEIPNAGAYDGNLSGYYYYVDHENIPAAELDNQQTFTVGGTTFTFSALDYAKAVVESTKMEPEQQNLAKALYLYNQKANAYFDVAHDHTPGATVHVSGTPATCSAAGSYYEVTYCTKCGEEVSRVAKTIDKLAHTPGTAVQENVVPASCSATGSYDEVVYCSECHEELSRETKTIDMLAHTIVAVAEVPATTEADGVAAHYECSVCHKLFSDAEGNNETTAEALVIPQIVENVVDLSTLERGYEAQDGDVLINALDGQKYIRIADGATIKLRNANITCLRNSSGINIAGLTLLGDATIILEGTNTIRGGYEYCPGIHVPEGKTLTIDGTGSLDVSSNGRGFACGIGSNDGTNCGNIVINGGNITAYAGTAAGIGAKSGSSCGNITINGGTVNATSGDYGAGIGSTLYGNSICGDITINGGVVNATANYEGPGIGSGTSANCGNITITGGTVTAIGGEEGAGIGTGNNVSICGNILITGGTVIAKGGNKAAGIGSGYRNTTCGTITIADTVTQVTATKGTDAPNSIGAGDSGSCGTVTIAPGANVIQN